MASAVGISLFAIAAAIVLPLLRHTGAITAPTPASLIWLTVAYVVASAPYVITASLLRAKRHGSGFLLMRATSTAITIAVAVVWISTWGANAAMAGSAAGTLCAALLGIRLATTWLREPASTA
jgi:hypothetical protein